MRQALAMAVLAVFSMFAALSAAGMGLFLYQAFKAWRQERRRLRIKRAVDEFIRVGNDPLTFRRR